MIDSGERMSPSLVTAPDLTLPGLCLPLSLRPSLSSCLTVIGRGSRGDHRHPRSARRERDCRTCVLTSPTCPSSPMSARSAGPVTTERTRATDLGWAASRHGWVQRKGHVPGWPLPDLSADRGAGVSSQRSFDELGDPLREITFVVVDLETTGGSSRTEAITEIGAVKVRGGEVLGEFATLVDPGRSIPPQITMLTGITDAMVFDAPRIGAVLPSFLEFIRGSVLVAHNAGFDVGFLRAACARLEPALAEARRRGHGAAGPQGAEQGRGAERAAVRAGPAAGRAGGPGPPGAHRRQGDGGRAARVVRAARHAGRAQPVGAAGRQPGRLAAAAPQAPAGRPPAADARASTCSAGRRTRCCTSAPRATCTSGSGPTSRPPRPGAGSSRW